MSNAYYKIYREQTMNLVRSMIIHLEWEGHAMNRELVELGYEIPADKRQWRYYMHLAGDYHHLDQPIYIKSLDTNEEVLLSKEVLRTHKKTRSVFIYGSEYVDALLYKYPKQTVLIRGILRPYDYSVTVNAENGKILWYDPTYVEVQEQDLIPELEMWIRSMYYQRFMNAYVRGNNLYIAAFTAILFANMPKQIMVIRKQKLKTAQTHSFHIRQYLASHQAIDEFVNYLTLEQMLFLYLNILYLERHTGLQDSFDTLVDKLLTLRNLPLYDYTLRQRDHKVSDGEFLPSPTFSREQLNMKTGLSSRDLDLWDIGSIVTKETPLAYDNARFLNDHIVEAEVETSFSGTSNLPTKLMEVAAIDPEDIEAIKLIDVLATEWAHMAALGIYNNRIEVVNPINGEIMQLDTKTAFLMFTYGLYYGFNEIRLEEITEVPAFGALTKRWIAPQEYLSIVGVDTYGGWDKEIDYFVNTHIEIFNDILTTEEFLDTCREIMDRRRRRNNYVFQTFRLHERIARKKFYQFNYKDYRCRLNPPNINTYHDLFSSLEFDYMSVSMEGWVELTTNIFAAATGFTADAEIGVKDVQSAMVRLFKRLSSYTVQFVEEIVSEETLVADSRVVLVHNSGEFSEASVSAFRRPITALKEERLAKLESKVQHGPVKVLNAELHINRSTSTEKYIRVLNSSDRVQGSYSAIRPSISFRSVTVRELT